MHPTGQIIDIDPEDYNPSLMVKLEEAKGIESVIPKEVVVQPEKAYSEEETPIAD